MTGARRARLAALTTERRQQFRLEHAAALVGQLDAERGRIAQVGRRVGVAVADLQIGAPAAGHAHHQRQRLADTNGRFVDGHGRRPPAVLQFHPNVDVQIGVGIVGGHVVDVEGVQVTDIEWTHRYGLGQALVW